MATWTPRSAVRGGVPWESAFSEKNPGDLPWGRRVLGMANSYASSTAPKPSPSIIPHTPKTETDTPTITNRLPTRLHPLLENQLAANGELTVIERLNSLLDTGQFADVNVRVGKGNEQTIFKAHRLLLATASQPLYKLVYAVNSNPGANEITTVRITDVDPKAFERVLKYIYTDDISIDCINDAFAILKASKKWGLKDMEAKTLEVISNFLDNYNPSTDELKNELCELLSVIDSHKNGILDKCLNVMVKFSNEIIPSQGFINLDEHLIRKLISHPNFKHNNMLTLFESIRDWGMNQILQRHLKPSQLQPLVAELLSLINFSGIDDADFINTVLPSDCLGKADIIAFFMTRGMEIPRDLAFNNNKQLSSLSNDGSEYSKICRYRKGYKLPEHEIYLEHEVRFRCNKNIKILGVIFGFLFSNTDMGVTIHCQGPWETVQWTDIIQSYCRVSWEKMLTADVRLMFAEPTRLYANHSYKILVKIGRMSSGSSEVDLWGGDNGLGTAKAADADFYFLKAAVDPNKEVDESETDNQPGMITDLIYTIDEDQDAKLPPRRTRENLTLNLDTNDSTVQTTVNRRNRVPSPPYVRKRPSIVPLDEKPYDSASLYMRRISGNSPVDPIKSPEYTPTTTTRFRPSTESSMASAWTRTTTGNENEINAYYLRPPGRTVVNDSATLNYRSRDSITGQTNLRRPSTSSNLSSTSSLRETARSRLGDSLPSVARRESTTPSRFGRDSTSSLSRFGQSGSFSDTSTRFGRESSVSKSSRDFTPSIYRRDSAKTTPAAYTSRFNTGSTGTSSSYSGYSSNLGGRYSSLYSRR